MPSDKQTILLVDDVKFNLNLLVDTLKGDYRTVVAKNGEQALDRARSQRPDLILLDILLPDIDGYEVCRRLKADPATADIPIIFITAKGEVEDETKGLELGAVDYITKPFSTAIVQARARTHLELARARSELAVQNELLRDNMVLREEIEQIARHDLKTPLQAMLAIPEVLLEEMDLSGRHKDMVEMLKESGGTMLRMINMSLNRIRMEQGDYVLTPEPLDLLALIRRVVREMESLSRSLGVRTYVLLDGAEPGPGAACPAMGEEVLCYSMLCNLYQNALEASPEGGEVRLDLRSKSHGVELALHNQSAVHPSVRDRFFEKYVTHGKKRGTGLGAYSARLIARTHGGSVSMETSEEQGTTLTVRLPAAHPAA
jgi:CheY-like chemotaxis protein